MPKITSETQHLVEEVLAQIAEGKMSRAQAAERLGVTPRTVNRLMRQAEIKKPAGISRVKRESAQKARKTRQIAADMSLFRGISITSAAETAGCSTRTIYRYRKKILTKGQANDRSRET